MDFRWVAAIALWTMLSGPVFVRLAVPTPSGTASPAPVKSSALTKSATRR